MGGRWAGYYKNAILKLLPINGSKIKAKEIYEKSSFSTATTNKYLDSLTKMGFVERIQESQKNVFYKRCEPVRIKRLIEDFTKEITAILSEFPVELQHLEEDFKEKGLTITQTKLVTGDDKFLRYYLLTTLIRKVHDILKMALPEPLRYSDFYVGAFDTGVHMVPRKNVVIK